MAVPAGALLCLLVMKLARAASRFFIASGCPIGTTSLYRCTHLSEQLRTLGHDTLVNDWFDQSRISLATALEYDVLVLYRLSMSDPLELLVREARKTGKPVIFDTDDLVFEPELTVWHRAVRDLTPSDQAQHLQGVRGYLKTLTAADAVMVATPLLAELAQKRGKPAFVHRNALGDEMEALVAELLTTSQHEEKEKIIIGYGSGTKTHDVDFQEAATALEQVLDLFPRVELWLAGPLTVPVPLGRFGSRLRTFPLSDWQTWFRLLAKMDVALAPLEMNNVFCEAKSEIKFVEAGALGVPVVASRVGSYRDAIKNGVTGFLASKEEEWVTALRSLIEDATLRARMGQAAQLTVNHNYSSGARAKDLQQLFLRLDDELGK